MNDLLSSSSSRCCCSWRDEDEDPLDEDVMLPAPGVCSFLPRGILARIFDVPPDGDEQHKHIASWTHVQVDGKRHSFDAVPRLSACSMTQCPVKLGALRQTPNQDESCRHLCIVGSVHAADVSWSESVSNCLLAEWRLWMFQHCRQFDTDFLISQVNFWLLFRCRKTPPN